MSGRAIAMRSRAIGIYEEIASYHTLRQDRACEVFGGSVGGVNTKVISAKRPA
jgi:hypothetical protein